MRFRGTKVSVVTFLAILATVSLADGGTQSAEVQFSPAIPRAWDDEAMLGFEVPLAHAAASPKQIPSEYYYRIPVRPIFKSYPIYHPSREPRGYLESLAKKEPEIAFDAAKLKTEADWIRAGALVFDAPIEFMFDEPLNALVRSRVWYEKNRVPVSKDGVLPFLHYVVREKGKVEIGFLSCAQCHTRVMPNGAMIKGAQGNFPDDRAFAYETRLELARTKDRDAVVQSMRKFFRRSYAAPWLNPDPIARQMSLEEMLSLLEAIPQGVCARQGSNIWNPPHIPDLIGIKDRRYLDATGLDHHRSIGDLMRYAALNQGGDMLATFDGFRPAGDLPDPSSLDRYSDEQLYALALYIYSLVPPPNPNRLDALAARGQKVFDREGCASCHTPPLYTNNKLMPADGFEVPEEHLKTLDVLAFSVGTDPNLTLRSRRGTGYYKVPSIKGLWYRGPFGHNGSVATLEDWFDPRRVREDYVPTGFRGVGVKTRAVKGHTFGLGLSARDRKALIAFLKTL
jgi:hypothetical protein